jgi:hypothetical protein
MPGSERLTNRNRQIPRCGIGLTVAVGFGLPGVLAELPWEPFVPLLPGNGGLAGLGLDGRLGFATAGVGRADG